MANKLKLKIVSDGSSGGTRIFDQETGAKLDDVVAIDWGLSANDGATVAIVELRGIPVEICSQFDVVVAPPEVRINEA